MTQALSATEAGFTFEIAPGNLAATLIVPSGATPSAQTVIARLHDLGIHEFDDGAMLEALEKRKTAALSFGIARGTAPVDERAGKIDFRVPFSDPAAGILTRVEAGTVLASLGAIVPGTDGKDIFGKPIPHKKYTPAFSPGRNVAIDKSQVVATARGSLRMSNGTLWVEPLLEVPGQGSTGAKIEFDGDVSIKGCLEDNKSVQCTGSLIVGGAVEAAQVNVGGSVFVRGGMVGREKSKAIIRGDLHCRFIAGGWVAAGGDVIVQGEVVRSTIACTGRLIVAHGPIHSGEIVANGGVTCAALGNASGAATTVSVGIEQAQQLLNAQASAEIESNRRRVRTVREQIEPLMERLKQLTPRQREKVTELLADASELECKTEQLVAEQDRCRQDTANRACREIIVHEMLHPGVVIRFPDVEAVIRKPIKGPLKLLPQVIGQTSCIVVAVDGADGVLPLESCPERARSISSRKSHY